MSTPTETFGDIRAQMVANLRHPTECTEEIITTEATANALVNGCKNPTSVEGRFLDILDGAMQGAAGRYQHLKNTLGTQIKTLEEQKAALEAQLQLMQEGYTSTEKSTTDIPTPKADPIDVIAALVDKMNITTGNGSSGNLPHPTPFDGSEADTAKRTQAFRTFKTLVVTRWNARPQEFPTGRSKICYIATLVRGAASDGIMAGMERVNENPNDLTHGRGKQAWNCWTISTPVSLHWIWPRTRRTASVA
jgi:hypothetical protein